MKLIKAIHNILETSLLAQLAFLCLVALAVHYLFELTGIHGELR